MIRRMIRSPDFAGIPIGRIVPIHSIIGRVRSRLSEYRVSGWRAAPLGRHGRGTGVPRNIHAQRCGAFHLSLRVIREKRMPDRGRIGNPDRASMALRTMKRSVIQGEGETPRAPDHAEAVKPSHHGSPRPSYRRPRSDQPSHCHRGRVFRLGRCRKAGQTGNAPVVPVRRLPCDDADEGVIRASNRPSFADQGSRQETGSNAP